MPLGGATGTFVQPTFGQLNKKTVEALPWSKFLKYSVFGGKGFLALCNRLEPEKPVKVRPPESYCMIDYEA